MARRPPLDELLNGRVAVRVVRTLALYPTKEFTGRELAREAGVSASKAIHALDGLREHGLVFRRTVGRANLWRFEKKAALAGPLRSLFERENRLDQELRNMLTKALKRLPHVERAVLFGSRARGDASPTSDIDLLIVLDDGRHKEAFAEEFRHLRARMAERFGAHVQPVVYDRAEANRKRRDPLLRKVDAEGVVLVGAAA